MRPPPSLTLPHKGGGNRKPRARAWAQTLPSIFGFNFQTANRHTPAFPRHHAPELLRQAETGNNRGNENSSRSFQGNLREQFVEVSNRSHKGRPPAASRCRHICAVEQRTTGFGDEACGGRIISVLTVDSGSIEGRF